MLFIEEAKLLTTKPNFKGYIHDVGGPTANFRAPSCDKQLKSGLCKGKKCLAPERCPAVKVDHSDYLELLRKLRKIPGVKKIFIRSGIRFDYLIADKDESFFKECGINLFQSIIKKIRNRISHTCHH